MQLPTEIRQTINENLKTRDKNRESKTRDGKISGERRDRSACLELRWCWVARLDLRREWVTPAKKKKLGRKKQRRKKS
jgi:hypothetical protein